MTSNTIFVRGCEALLPRFQVTDWKKKAWGGGALPRKLGCTQSSKGWVWNA